MTTHFTLRLVTESDAEDLLACYSDETAWEIFNADNCTSDFRYRTLDEMRACVRFWMECYAGRGFVRFAVVDRQTGKAVGTVEMFGSSEAKGKVNEPWGLLRIDLATPYETEARIGELLRVFNDENFYKLFGVSVILAKAIPAAPERVRALKSAGYEPFEWLAGREHYFMRRNEKIKRTEISDEWAHSGVVEAGASVYISYCMGNEGQSVESQINGAFDVLSARLKSVGLTLESVAQMDCLFKDIADLSFLPPIMKERFVGKYPARKAFETKFIREGICFQVDAIAHRC